MAVRFQNGQARQQDVSKESAIRALSELATLWESRKRKLMDDIQRSTSLSPSIKSTLIRDLSHIDFIYMRQTVEFNQEM